MRKITLVSLALTAVLAGGASRIVQDQCGPFTDVTPGFCPFVLELYYLGITAGTSATTFSPDDPLTRGQGAVFIAKGLNQALARSSRRAALGQWWTTTPHYDVGLGVTTLSGTGHDVKADGVDLWITTTSAEGGKVDRVRASDGKLLETWTGLGDPTDVLVAMGRVFVVGGSIPNGILYMIDPAQPASTPLIVSTQIVAFPGHIGFDGTQIWVGGGGGEISLVQPSSTVPWPVTHVPGFTAISGFVFDGAYMWVSDASKNSLRRLDSNGAVLQTVATGAQPIRPTYDGANIWVPNGGDDTVTIVQSSTGMVLTTLSGNGLSIPVSSAFDGRRVLVRGADGGISLWNASDLTPIGSATVGVYAQGVCSNGVDFFFPIDPDLLARF